MMPPSTFDILLASFESYGGINAPASSLVPIGIIRRKTASLDTCNDIAHHPPVALAREAPREEVLEGAHPLGAEEVVGVELEIAEDLGMYAMDDLMRCPRCITLHGVFPLATPRPVFKKGCKWNVHNQCKKSSTASQWR